MDFDQIFTNKTGSSHSPHFVLREKDQLYCDLCLLQLANATKVLHDLRKSFDIREDAVLCQHILAIDIKNKYQ